MALNSNNVVQMVETGKVRRQARTPVHTHLIVHRPWQIQPFMIAPVLPGETLKNLSVQSRVISDPIKAGPGNILPWWCEHYLFYVKVRQLGPDVRAAFEAMMLQGTPLGLVDPVDLQTMHYGKTVNWVNRCLNFVVEEGGFRNEGEAADVSEIDGLPAAAAHRHGQSFLDSLTADAALQTPNDLQDPQDPLMLEAYLEQYEAMRGMRLIDMTFEDYLATYGVNLPQAALLERPELIRMNSEWAYPANTIDPATGAATGAASFGIQFRADKDRFFAEPGFVFGVTVVRPKIFLANQKSAAVSMLDTAYSFLPRILASQPHISLREFLGGVDASATGPLRNQTAGYWLDVGDLFRYGDQFTNVADAKGFNLALPNAAGEKRWATLAMAKALFADDTKSFIRQDGVTRLNVLGHPQTTEDMT